MSAKQRQALTAVIYDKRGRVLSVGQNSYSKTHTIQAKWAAKTGFPEKVYLHAEIASIVKCRDLSRAHRIFISRWDHNGNPKLAAPCEVCMSAIRAAGIKKVDWTV